MISFKLGDNESLNFNNLNKSYKSDKKIKIGYFSADFRKHAVGNLVVNLFELHDKSKFEIYCFYFGPDTNDEIYQRISNTVYKFINVRYKSEKEIAQLKEQNKKLQQSKKVKKSVQNEIGSGFYVSKFRHIEQASK